MGATNTTANLELSQFVGSDKPDWLTDYNGDMLKIDGAYGAVSATAEEAAANAESAAASATQAAADASEALAGISGAIDAAAAAQTAAEQATSVSTSALTVANGAAATAQSAAGDATQALSIAQNAKQTAENAQAAAAQAVSDVAGAVTAAENATAAANAATSAAGSASDAASAASAAAASATSAAAAASAKAIHKYYEATAESATTSEAMMGDFIKYVINHNEYDKMENASYLCVDISYTYDTNKTRKRRFHKTENHRGPNTVNHFGVSFICSDMVFDVGFPVEITGIDCRTNNGAADGANAVQYTRTINESGSSVANTPYQMTTGDTITVYIAESEVI